MATISLCMIVKDEEWNLANCLDSVKDIMDEIIIVDTGSTDLTKEIALLYTDKVYDFVWQDDFAAARNYSFSLATMDFIMWLDADDVIRKSDRNMLRLLRDDLTPEIDAVIMKYILVIDEDGKELSSSYRERVVRREKGFKWLDPIHEYLDIKGVILHTEIAVTHTKKGNSAVRNLDILKKVIAQDNEIHPRHFYYFARESQIIGDIDTAIEYFLKFLEMPGDRPCHYTEACLQLASIYMERGDKKAALRILTRSFEFEPMRAEVLCLIGQYYRLAEDFATAIPWFELALAQTKPFTWEFIMHEYWDFIPCMELCHCYYWTGNHTKAQEYHERARRLKPSDPGVIYNQQFFNGITQ